VHPFFVLAFCAQLPAPSVADGASGRDAWGALTRVPLPPCAMAARALLPSRAADPCWTLLPLDATGAGVGEHMRAARTRCVAE